MKWIGKLLGFSLLVLAAAAVFLFLAASGHLGRPEGPGEITRVTVPIAQLEQRRQAQQAVAMDYQAPQILFGDFHVHTSVSGDGFTFSLPLLGGEGTRPQGDACDFARYCSALDFWSINDHAEELTAKRWSETVAAIRDCNAVAGDPENPDMVAFLGWEWTQMGGTPEDHYGHKNIVLAGIEDGDIPTRPISARAAASLPPGFTVPKFLRALLLLIDRDRRSLDAGRYYAETELARENICPRGIPVRELPLDCMEDAATPAELFAKLDDWDVDALVIPHGTSWGNYTPPGASWSKQLTPEQHDPARQLLVEIYSGHGNAEDYRSWRAVREGADGEPGCPSPTASYLPSCWRAGEIIQERCLATGTGEDECERRAAQTRQAYIDRGNAGHLVVPGAEVEDWQDAGQCRDCFIPAFNHRPMSSVQAMLAMSNPLQPGPVQRFRFGIIGSSDNHSARPGTGYKERDRREMTEATGLRRGLANPLGKASPQPQPDLVDIRLMNVMQRAEMNRITSFFSTGGLVAAHSNSRSRSDIWSAIRQRHVYGTSGERILLWFDLLNGRPSGPLPMGSEIAMHRSPQFRVKAAGAFRQLPGCPQFSREALGEDRLYQLCRNECYNPSEERKRIDRIEIVKITPQKDPGEALGPLIQDPWMVHECEDNPVGCSFSFTDPGFASAGRDSVYYVRAIQESSEAVNGNNLRCERDESGRCLKLNPCHGNEDQTDYQDDCLAPVQERAWSSPIFVDHRVEGQHRESGSTGLR